MASLPPASFSIENILILGSQFSRAAQISIGITEQDLAMQTSTGKAETGELTAELNINLKGIQEGNEVFSFAVKAIGIFRRTEDSELDEDAFLRVNAPAIIFPFIREHIASLGVKAGLGPILLPPVNFVRRNSEQEEMTSSQ